MRSIPFALAVALALPAHAEPARSRSVRQALGGESAYASGFRPGDCPDLLGLLGSGSTQFTKFPLVERVRRVHALAWHVNGPGPHEAGLTEQVVRLVAELGAVDHVQLRPHGHELLIIIARLGSHLNDEPSRPKDVYYGVREFIEKVVNLGHEDKPATHALLAHALARLAEMRVSRLKQIGRFDDQIREAFEDLERVQREDALGDNTLLRLTTTLVVLTRVIPAFDLYEANERPLRALELNERLDPVEDAVRAFAGSRVPADDPRLTVVLTELDRAQTLASTPLLTDVRQRLLNMKRLMEQRAPVGGGGGGAAGLQR